MHILVYHEFGFLEILLNWCHCRSTFNRQFCDAKLWVAWLMNVLFVMQHDNYWYKYESNSSLLAIPWHLYTCFEATYTCLYIFCRKYFFLKKYLCKARVLNIYQSPSQPWLCIGKMIGLFSSSTTSNSIAMKREIKPQSNSIQRRLGSNAFHLCSVKKRENRDIESVD